MVGEHPTRARSTQCIELQLPHLPGFSRAFDQSTAGDVRQIAILLPVVECPLDGYLHHRALPHRQLVGMVGVHQTGVVEKPSLEQQFWRTPGQIPHRCAVTDRSDTGHLGQCLQTPVERLDLLGQGQRGRLFVQVPVVGDLVSGFDDTTHRGGVAMCGVSRYEEGRPNLVRLQELENPRYPDQWPVGLMRHHAHPRRNGVVAPQHRRLGVHVERECRRGRLTAGPWEIRSHRPSE